MAAMKEGINRRRETIYELMQGNIDLQHVSVVEAGKVKNEFAEGEWCDILYEEVYNAAERLRTGDSKNVEADVDCILNNLSLINRHLCYKMYDYAIYFQKHSFQ